MSSTVNASTSLGLQLSSDTSGVLQLQTANTTAVTIDASQNVGIGTSSPLTKTTINGGVTLIPTYETYLVNAYYNSGWKYIGNGVAWGIGNNFNGVTNGVTIATASVNAGGAGAALTWTPALNIDTSGNVGIGTASPGAKLDVTGNILAATGQTGSLQLNGGAGYTQVVAYGSATDVSLNLYAKGAAGVTFSTNNGVLQLAAAGLGYGSGSGGTVTQATNKSTAVTLNKPTGQITMNNAALAAGASVGFTLINSIISSTDTVVVAVTNSDGYRYGIQRVQAGSCNIFITNNTGGSLSDAIIINFTIIKGAIA